MASEPPTPEQQAASLKRLIRAITEIQADPSVESNPSFQIDVNPALFAYSDPDWLQWLRDNGITIALDANLLAGKNIVKAEIWTAEAWGQEA